MCTSFEQQHNAHEWCRKRNTTEHSTRDRGELSRFTLNPSPTTTLPWFWFESFVWKLYEKHESSMSKKWKKKCENKSEEENGWIVVRKFCILLTVGKDSQPPSRVTSSHRRLLAATLNTIEWNKKNLNLMVPGKLNGNHDILFILFFLFSKYNFFSHFLILIAAFSFSRPIALCRSPFFSSRPKKNTGEQKQRKLFIFHSFLFSPLFCWYLFTSFHFFSVPRWVRQHTTEENDEDEKKRSGKNRYKFFKCFIAALLTIQLFRETTFDCFVWDFHFSELKATHCLVKMKKINWNELKLRPCGRHLCPHKLRILHTCHMKLW